MQANSTVQTVVAEDDFLASLRINQNFTSDVIGVKKPLLTVPIRKPGKSDFIRVHPEHHIDCLMVELKAEREHYYVRQEVAMVIAEFAEPVRLRLCVTRQGVVFLWPIKLPRDDRRADAWRLSAAEAACLGESRWMRLSADMGLGAYQPHVAVADLGDPKWPEESWSAILKVALRDRMIESGDHAVIRELLGQA